MWLQGGMLRRRRTVDILENEIGFRKSAFDIAMSQFKMATNVTVARDVLDYLAEVGLLFRPWIVHKRRSGIGSLVFVKNGWEFFVLDPNERDGFFGNVRINRRNCGNRIANETDLVKRHNGLIAVNPTISTDMPGSRTEIAPRQHSFNACETFRAGRVYV
jgi:hypothetical protein